MLAKVYAHKTKQTLSLKANVCLVSLNVKDADQMERVHSVLKTNFY